MSALREASRRADRGHGMAGPLHITLYPRRPQFSPLQAPLVDATTPWQAATHTLANVVTPSSPQTGAKRLGQPLSHEGWCRLLVLPAGRRRGGIGWEMQAAGGAEGRGCRRARGAVASVTSTGTCEESDRRISRQVFEAEREERRAGCCDVAVCADAICCVCGERSPTVFKCWMMW